MTESSGLLCKAKQIRQGETSILWYHLYVVVVQSPSRVQLFVSPWTAAHQASLSLTISRGLLKFKSIASMSHPAISSSDTLFSFCPKSFPVSGTFPVSRPFASNDQNTGASASASVLSMSIQDRFPLRLTALISLLSKGLSEVFSSTTVRRHQFFGVLPSLGSSLHNHTWPLGRP